jgi:hypothetical protein
VTNSFFSKSRHFLRVGLFSPFWENWPDFLNDFIFNFEYWPQISENFAKKANFKQVKYCSWENHANKGAVQASTPSSLTHKHISKHAKMVV